MTDYSALRSWAEELQGSRMHMPDIRNAGSALRTRLPWQQRPRAERQWRQPSGRPRHVPDSRKQAKAAPVASATAGSKPRQPQ